MAKDGEMQRRTQMNQNPKFLEIPSSAPDEKALQICEDMLASVPDHLGALESAAKIYWRRGDWLKAISFLSRAIAVYPYDPGYFLLRADCLQGQGRFLEAMADLERCLVSLDHAVAEQAYTRMQELKKWHVSLADQARLPADVADPLRKLAVLSARPS